MTINLREIRSHCLRTQHPRREDLEDDTCKAVGHGQCWRIITAAGCAQLSPLAVPTSSDIGMASSESATTGLMLSVVLWARAGAASQGGQGAFPTSLQLHLVEVGQSFRVSFRVDLSQKAA